MAHNWPFCTVSGVMEMRQRCRKKRGRLVYVRRSKRCNNKDVEERVNVGERRERCHIGKFHRAKARTRNTADASAFVHWIKY